MLRCVVFISTSHDRIEKLCPFSVANFVTNASFTVSDFLVASAIFPGKIAATAEKSLRLQKNRCDTMGSVPILSQRFSQSQSLTVNDT